ncbi:MAG: electron transfer flavoprotein subunit alpha/FixB family protein [Candidatus Eiseniibacteriota bacterium]
MAILVFIEQREGEIRRTSYEAVSEARRLADAGMGGDVIALLVGAPGSEGPAAEAGAFGADQVWFASDASFAKYQPEGYAVAVAAAAKKSDAGAVLFSASAMGKDLAPRVAALLGVGLATDCTHLDLEGGRLVATRPVYAGKAVQRVAFPGKPALASLRPKVFPLVEHRSGATAPVTPLEFAFDVSQAKSNVGGTSAQTSGPADLTEADIIVSGGRGLKGPENFHLIEDLAKALGATVGASRAVVDAGWRPHSEQVGQTGKTVSPKLYVAIGISGAIQHLAGMSSARCIVAINKDADAPIFKIANYGIVGDAFEIVPALTEAIKKLH